MFFSIWPNTLSEYLADSGNFLLHWCSQEEIVDETDEYIDVHKRWDYLPDFLCELEIISEYVLRSVFDLWESSKLDCRFHLLGPSKL